MTARERRHILVAVYELVVVGLRLWLLGSAVFLVFALSDAIFDKKHSVRTFAARLFFVATWPLALCSHTGRTALFGKLEGI